MTGGEGDGWGVGLVRAGLAIEAPSWLPVVWGWPCSRGACVNSVTGAALTGGVALFARGLRRKARRDGTARRGGLVRAGLALPLPGKLAPPMGWTCPRGGCYQQCRPHPADIGQGLLIIRADFRSPLGESQVAKAKRHFGKLTASRSPE